MWKIWKNNNNFENAILFLQPSQYYTRDTKIKFHLLFTKPLLLPAISDKKLLSKAMSTQRTLLQRNINFPTITTKCEMKYKNVIKIKQYRLLAETTERY